MNTVHENDTRKISPHRSLPNTPDEILKAQQEVEKHIALADELRAKSGASALTAEQKAHCFTRLHLPVPTHYQQNR